MLLSRLRRGEPRLLTGRSVEEQLPALPRVRACVLARAHRMPGTAARVQTCAPVYMFYF